ncbi:TIR domain-containing protein [Pinibacter soli]|uniref:TIR domain-containing protein n=1 Tax=Pinibacter soli TaxID=3044211 RepID=A0ABT6RI01_9BACT|nr:TIR domain-containing protein [Pinibacter soli]MDI3322005.1 TIR domain-containing protein [Pinibacter soli]
MARRVFFSFHYENDVWRTNIVRNSWLTKPDSETAGFIDAAEFESVKKGGDSAIKKWIDNQLVGTTVTVVLIGSETSNRDYIKYELEQSWKRGNGIIGIYIHQLKDRYGNSSLKGNNTFGPLFSSQLDSKKYFYERFETYDWVDDDGYNNFGKWVDIAAKKAGK